MFEKNKWIGFCRVLGASLGLLLLNGTEAQAKPWADASVFSMNESQLRSVYPELKNIDSPKIRAGGVRGQWKLPDVKVGGFIFDSVLFARDGKLQRIEHVWSVISNPCLGRAVYEDVVAALTAQLGKSDASGETVQGKLGQRSTVWTVGETYLIARVNQLDYQCSVRLVNKPRLLTNGSPR